MLTYAQKEFELNRKPKGSNCTLREHLLSIQAQAGETPPELKNIEISPAVSYLLGFFYEISLSRQSGMGLCPITYAEIEAWDRLFKMNLAMWEISVVRQLDVIFLNTQNEVNNGDL
ncbi:hypothetical protein [Actinobacillus porcinus]|uniref:phage tail assembly chaperone n=1 Tax=Actinobacillus porcinus TaxID=51048 RepID=UPI0023580062|nr:hypothetical protein [Actinobacillus porcinus]MDD7545572.1 hypothetical protein [Actinobacillus porcinus]